MLPPNWRLQPCERSFRYCIRLLLYLPKKLEVLLSPTKKNNHVHCVVFPTIALTEYFSSLSDPQKRIPSYVTKRHSRPSTPLVWMECISKPVVAFFTFVKFVLLIYIVVSCCFEEFLKSLCDGCLANSSCSSTLWSLGRAVVHLEIFRFCCRSGWRAEMEICSWFLLFPKCLLWLHGRNACRLPTDGVSSRLVSSRLMWESDASLLWRKFSHCSRVFVKFFVCVCWQFCRFPVLRRPCGDCVLSYPCVCVSRALLVVESPPSDPELVKTTETVESSFSTRAVIFRGQVWKLALSDGGASKCNHGRGGGHTGWWVSCGRFFSLRKKKGEVYEWGKICKWHVFETHREETAAARISHDSPSTFYGPGLQKNNRNSTRKHPEKHKKNDMGAGEGKERAKFWAVRRRVWWRGGPASCGLAHSNPGESTPTTTTTTTNKTTTTPTPPEWRPYPE